MWLTLILGGLVTASLGLALWQLVAGLRFPLHRGMTVGKAPAVTLFKPLKGCDPQTRECLESWLTQNYAGSVQVLFGAEDESDPVCEVVRDLIRKHPETAARLVICGPALGPNRKVSKWMSLERHARHDLWVMSDADVCVPSEFLGQLVAELKEEGVGMVHCFYRLGRPSSWAQRWEAVSVNADFWSQVLQARGLGMEDFALGAVMATTRSSLEKTGGFAALVDYLADDFQLGRRMTRHGFRIALCRIVVECREQAQDWAGVWQHQLRWARTVRFSRPGPYFWSVVSNVTLWAMLLCGLGQTGTVWVPLAPASMTAVGRPASGIELSWGLAILAGSVLVRLGSALVLQARLTRSWEHLRWWWMVPVKDLMQGLLWVVSWTGSAVVWRGERLQLSRSGVITPLDRK